MKIHPSLLLMQQETLFSMKNEFCTLPDATRDFIYDEKFI
jgi:hypothetical protein